MVDNDVCSECVCMLLLVLLNDSVTFLVDLELLLTKID
jgi:hypothetical protein